MTTRKSVLNPFPVCTFENRYYGPGSRNGILKEMDSKNYFLEYSISSKHWQYAAFASRGFFSELGIDLFKPQPNLIYINDPTAAALCHRRRLKIIYPCQHLSPFFFYTILVTQPADLGHFTRNQMYSFYLSFHVEFNWKKKKLYAMPPYTTTVHP